MIHVTLNRQGWGTSDRPETRCSNSAHQRFIKIPHATPGTAPVADDSRNAKNRSSGSRVRGMSNPLRKLARLTKASATFLILLGLTFHSQANCQDPTETAAEAPTSNTERELKGQTDDSHKDDSSKPELDQETQERIATLINQLGAPKFALRESAADGLLKIGVPALPALRKALENATEQETKQRIDELVGRLIDGQIEVQIQDFLLMKDVKFDGWNEIRTVLGNDNIPTRKLFTEILTQHPGLPEAMQIELTPRDRSIALQKVINVMEEKKSKEMPTTANAFALLLPLTDPNVKMPAACENLVIDILQFSTGTTIRNDPNLSGPFKALLAYWVIQSSPENREDTFFYGMDWGLDRACRQLALNTLTTQEDASVNVVAASLQALAKCGVRQDAAVVIKLLDDARPVSPPAFTAQGKISNQLSDLAIASIACLYGIEFEDVGFKGVKPDPKFGFIVKEIGFPENEPEKRKEAQEMIRAILSARPPLQLPLAD